VTVRDGKRRWTYAPEWGAVSNVAAGEEGEGMSAGGGELWAPLLDPSVWIPALGFEIGGDAEAIGRLALRVRVTRRELYGSDPFLFRTQLAVGADDYEFLVDRERGVVLRIGALRRRRVLGQRVRGARLRMRPCRQRLSSSSRRRARRSAGRTSACTSR